MSAESSRTTFVRTWAPYVIKAAIVLALLYGLTRLLPHMPPIAVGLTWAVLSIVLAIGFAYYSIVSKKHRQTAIEEGGIASRINDGRFFSLVIQFIVAAILIAGLILQAPHWHMTEWGIIVCAIPLFMLVALLVTKLFGGEIATDFRKASIARITVIVTTVLLVAVYLLVIWQQPHPEFVSIMDAYQRHQGENIFAQSPSALLAEAGKIDAYTETIVTYGMSRVSEVSYTASVVWRLLGMAATFGGIAAILGLCLFDLRDIQQVFQPISANTTAAVAAKAEPSAATPEEEHIQDSDQENSQLPVQESAKESNQTASHSKVPFYKRYLILAAALPLVLTAAFVVADGKVAQIVATDEHAALESIIKEQIGGIACKIDGKLYPNQVVEMLKKQSAQEQERLSQDAAKELEPLINAAFDARKANVNNFLEWYYSLPAEWERLQKVVTGKTEEFIEEKLKEKLEEGVDDSVLNEAYERHRAEFGELEAHYKEELAKYEISEDQAWLYSIKKQGDFGDIFPDLEPPKFYLSTEQRVGLGTAVGGLAGIIGGQIVKKAASKTVVKEVVKAIGKVLGSKGVAGRIGGVVGSAIAPGLGTAGGFLAGLGISVGVDYVILMFDKAINGEEYQKELEASIEEARETMLADLHAQGAASGNS